MEAAALVATAIQNRHIYNHTVPEAVNARLSQHPYVVGEQCTAAGTITVAWVTP